MKKIIAALLIACVSVCFASCGKPKIQTTALDVPVDAPQKAEEKIADITVYFPDDNMMYLHPVTMTADISDGIYKKVAESVISGPSEDSPYIKPVRGEVSVISATLDSTTGICTLDLSKEFAEKNTGGSTREIMAIYSLVNSLCEIDGVKSVKINIAGDADPKFGGHFSLETPFEKEESYIQK